MFLVKHARVGSGFSKPSSPILYKVCYLSRPFRLIDFPPVNPAFEAIEPEQRETSAGNVRHSGNFYGFELLVVHYLSPADNRPVRKIDRDDELFPASEAHEGYEVRLI